MKNYQMVHLRLPLDLVKDLDSVVSKAGASRNEIVREAVSHYITGMRMAEQIRKAYGCLEEIDAPEWADGGRGLGAPHPRGGRQGEEELGYLIDTCVFIDLLMDKLPEAGRDWLATNAEAGLTKTSCIVYHELLFGANTYKAHKEVEDLLRGWTILPVDQAVAARAAIIRRRWKTGGENLGMADALVAATAELHELKVVTSDTKGFPKESVINLREIG